MTTGGDANERGAHQMRQVAIVLANIAGANAEVEAMKAANHERRSHGYSDAYGDEQFREVINTWQIHSNAVITTLNQ
jgi:hypothetical protein